MNKLKEAGGYSLIEIILVILILAIAIPPIIHLFSYTLENSVDSEIYTKAALFAEERIEEDIADKRASSSGKGYNYIFGVGRYPNDTPETGYDRSVSIDTVGMVYNGVRYAEITVTIDHANIEDVVLTTWVTDYD